MNGSGGSLERGGPHEEVVSLILTMEAEKWQNPWDNAWAAALNKQRKEEGGEDPIDNTQSIHVLIVED